MDHQRAKSGWVKLLNPDILRSNLIAASLFLSAFETMRSSIIGHILEFYSNGFDEQGAPTVDAKYRTDVLALNASPFRASLLWLRQRQVFDDSDLTNADKIREHRNEIAHRLPEFVSMHGSEINHAYFQSIFEVVAKVDRWWIREVEIPTNPAFDDQDVAAIPDDEIQSGNMIFLQLLSQVATGDEASSRVFYEEFLRRSSAVNSD